MPLGKLGRKRSRKKHPSYKSSPKSQLPSRTLRVPRGTGFTELQAQAMYDGVENRLLVTVTARRAPENLGPGIFDRRVVEDWHRHQVAAGDGVKLLDGILQEYAGLLRAGKMPERSLYLETCKPQGSDMMVFTERVCGRCHCPYCELSQA